MEQTVSDYLALRQCASQWRGMLRAFSAVVAQELEAAPLRDALHAVGMRFAQDHPLPGAQTLEEIQDHMNVYWQALDWGWVVLSEGATHVTIQHCCGPLTAAFGNDGLPWSAALLEGVYTHWFRAMGAGEQLRVRQASPLDAYGNVEFHLGQ